jgi:DUF1680 family protein
MFRLSNYSIRRRCVRAIVPIALGSGILAAADYPVRPVPFTNVSFTGGLWHDRQETNVRVTLPFALGQCESSKRLLNFDLAAETMKRRAAGEGGFQNKPVTQYPFDDSDVFKVLEGAAFCLSVKPDANLTRQIEAIIARVAAAQEQDGYLYTWRTMHPDSPAHPWIHQQRWLKDPEVSHELYNLGHLYEAGVAHAQATGTKSLLDICLKSAELVDRDFAKGGLRVAPGHQVIEMGLAKLYRSTGDKRWLDLVRIFLETRGKGPEYSQDHQPVLAQRKAVGHAVRANYLYSGMADVAALGNDPRYLEAITAIWENVVTRKLHLTGGCGARAAGEAYGDDYELPNRCYNETCAAIAFLYWNHRMFLMTGDGKFMDVFERTLHNGFLSGVSLSGDRFFYPNPLEYDGVSRNNHGHAGRAPWFGCACCPPNVLRMMASIGGYVYAVKDRELFVNLYAAGNGTAEVNGGRVKITQETGYPWSGGVKLHVDPAVTAAFDLCLRIPGWVRGTPVPGDLYSYDDPSPANWSVKVNGATQDVSLANGYAKISREWKPGDVVELDLPMPVRRVAANPQVSDTRGLVALERGPIVYCFEGTDNGGAVLDVALPPSATATPSARPDMLGGVTVLEVKGAERFRPGSNKQFEKNPVNLVGIPYAFWNNRGLAPMTVWLGRDSDHVRLPLPPTLATRAKVTASFCREGMDLARLNDQQMPRNATDGFAANFDFWPHLGGGEWVAYEFPEPARVGEVTVSWFDDTSKGGACKLPKAWRLLYQDERGGWKPVDGVREFPVRIAEPVTVQITPVTAKALKLELDLAEGASAGIYEWEVRSPE